jgi:putative ABC transport system permease protein
MISDLRFAVRMLIKYPAFSGVALVAIALGIGANTAIFSALNTLLLRPLPVEDIDRLVSTFAMREGFDPFECSFLEYAAYRDRSHVFASSGVATQRSFNLTGHGEPERIRGATMKLDYLNTLGVQPILGRVFSPQEDRAGGAPVALISYALWQKHFGGSAAAIGQALNLDQRTYNIIGVMPAGFDLPAAAEIWTPLQTNIETLPLRERAATNNEIVARLKPGVTVNQADAELKAIARQLEQEYPEFRHGWSVKVVSLRQNLLGDLEGHVRKALFVILAGVGFLLLICCANVANLQLARGVAREREFAVRRALGAGRAQLVRQLLTESVLLAFLGGVAGLLLTECLLPILATLNPIRGISFSAFFHNFEIDRRVLAFAFVLTLVTGIGFGLLPALSAAGVDELMVRMKRTDQRSGAASASGRRLFNGLIVTEIAMALTLLVCGGLMMQSFQRLQHLDLGFRPNNLLTFKMVLPESKYSQYHQRVAFAEALLEKVRSLPGVISAGTTTNVPLEREILYDAIFAVEGRPPANPNDVPITSNRIVSPDYLQTLGVTLVKGRLIEKADRAQTLPIVVVSEEFAHQAWPEEDPIGKRVRRLRGDQAFPWMTVVGLVRNVKEDLFNYRINRPVWYVPYAQVENSFPLNLVVRAKIDPTSLTATIRDAVHQVDPDQPVSDVMTMHTNLSGVLVTERFGSVLMGALAVSGSLLAAIGLYGVMAYAVRQRTGEIGLRVALGAQRKHVLALIMGGGAKLTFLGVAIGLLAAWSATRLVVSLLFGISATDLVTFVSVSVLLGVVALLACYLPARAAMHLDPVDALRYE